MPCLVKDIIKHGDADLKAKQRAEGGRGLKKVPVTQSGLVESGMRQGEQY